MIAGKLVLNDLLRVVSVLTVAKVSIAGNEDCWGPGAVTVVNRTGESLLGCNQTTLTCDSLQEALNIVKTLNVWNGSSTEAFTICLPQGHFYITNQTHFGNASLQIIGAVNVTVECDYPVEMFTEDGVHYTWYFDQSHFLRMENIHFLNCPFPLRTIAVLNVTIKDCKFTHFSEAVFDIFNCESVNMESVLIYNNNGSGILPETFRGNTGGVALGYYEYPENLNPPNVQVSDCKFINNSALASHTFLTSERAVSSQVFTGRGGGLGIFINESNLDISIEVSDCQFVNNYARSFGGGVFMIINGYTTQHILTFKRNNFVSNFGQVGGGGVQLAFLSATDTNEHPHSVVFSDSNFDNNVGEAGGGIYIFTSFVGTRGNSFRFESCNFTNNHGPGTIDEFGAAIGITLFTIFEQRVTAVRHDIINCTFMGNSGGNGIVSLGYSPVKFSGTNLFVGNLGAAVRIVGSLVDFQGHLRFVNNSAIGEGALSLLSFGQMRMNKGLSIDFDGNTGRLGASITVATPDRLSSFTRLLYNSECFAIYEDPFKAPTEWEEVTVNFDSNSAVLGSCLYLSRVGHCSWFSQSSPYFRQKFVRNWPFWNYGNNTNTGYEEPYSPDYYVGTHAREISINTDVIDSWPGQRFSMSITGVDQFDHVTSTNARFFTQTRAVDLDVVASGALKFKPQIVVIAGAFEQGLLTDKFPMYYTVSSKRELHDIIDGPPTIVGVEEPFDTLPITAGQFSLRAKICPGGYKLTPVGAQNETESMCVCIDTPNILACEDDQDGVIVRDGYWSGYVPSQQPNLFFYPCPPRYCQCTHNSSLGSSRCVYMYTHSDPNLQCNDDREGLLCGSCRNNSGVSVLLDHCVTCSNGYGALILLLVLLDVIVFIIVVLIDRAVPEWIYPFIFYVQMAPHVSTFFPQSFEYLGVYLNFVRSGLGLYFVYDFCLHSSLPALVSYSLRYLPFLIAVIVCPTIWIVRKYLLKKKSLKHHGYWLIAILLYPQLVHTSLSILNCPQLPDSNGTTVARWFVDASVQCFSGWHIALALLAIATLLVCLLAIVATVVLTYKKPDFFKKFIPPLTVGCKEEVEWWSGMELGRRLLFLVLLIAFPKNTVYAIQALVILLSTYAYILPYKSTIANTVEIILLLNLLVLMLLDATPLIRETLFTFSPQTGIDAGRRGVSHISWLLFSFYYLPVVLLAGVTIVVPIGLVFRHYVRRKTASNTTNETVCAQNPFSELRNKPSTSQVVQLSDLEDEDGDAGLVELTSQYYRHGD